MQAPMKTISFFAGGPVKWLLTGVSAVAKGTEVIVAGEEELGERCCWEQILHEEGVSDAEAEICHQHGMLLAQLLRKPQCEACQCQVGDENRLIVKNKWNE